MKGKIKWAALCSTLLLRVSITCIISSLARYLVEFTVAFPTISQSFLNWLIILSVGVNNILRRFILQYIRMNGFYIPCFIGAIIVSVALLLASLSTNHIQLMVSHGLLFGFGLSIVYGVCFFVLSDFFPPDDECHVLAFGLNTCNTAIGTFLGSYIVDAMLPHLGWRWCLLSESIYVLILGTIMSLVAFRKFDLTIKAEKTKKEREIMMQKGQHTDNNDTDNTTMTRMETIITIIWCSLWFFKALAIYFPHSLLIMHAVNINLTAHQGTICIMLLGILEFASRLATAFSGKIIHGHTLKVSLLCSVALVGTSIWGYYADTFSKLQLYSAVYGLFVGPIAAASVCASGEVLKGKYFKEVASYTGIGAAFGIALGLYIDGLVFDKYGSYDIMFLVHAGCYLIDVVLLLVILKLRTYI